MPGRAGYHSLPPTGPARLRATLLVCPVVCPTVSSWKKGELENNPAANGRNWLFTYCFNFQKIAQSLCKPFALLLAW